MVLAIVFPTVSEEGESEVKSSSRSSPVSCESTVRVCAVSGDAASCKSGVRGTVKLRLSTTASGPAVAVPFILDIGSQYNVIGCAVLEKLQLKFPGTSIVRPANLSVGMAN